MKSLSEREMSRVKNDRGSERDSGEQAGQGSPTNKIYNRDCDLVLFQEPSSLLPPAPDARLAI